MIKRSKIWIGQAKHRITCQGLVGDMRNRISLDTLEDKVLEL